MSEFNEEDFPTIVEHFESKEIMLCMQHWVKEDTFTFDLVIDNVTINMTKEQAQDLFRALIKCASVLSEKIKNGD